ncbi:hypothetical protein Tco_1549310 [Tanacetum coccineum]
MEAKAKARMWNGRENTEYEKVISEFLTLPEDSVGTSVGRVILFDTIPTTIPDTTLVISPPTTQTDTTVIPQYDSARDSSSEASFDSSSRHSLSYHSSPNLPKHLLRGHLARDWLELSARIRRLLVKCLKHNLSQELKAYVGIDFSGTEGVDSALTWWNTHKRTIGVNAAYAMKWDELMRFQARFSRSGSYPGSFLSLLDRDRKPTILQDAIRIANNLMDQKLKGYARSAENKRMLENNLRENHGLSLCVDFHFGGLQPLYSREFPNILQS